MKKCIAALSLVMCLASMNVSVSASEIVPYVFVKGKVKRKGTKKLSGRSTCSLGPWARHMSLFNAPVRNFPCSS